MSRLNWQAHRIKHRRLIETVLAAILLGALAAIVFGPNAIHGGWISDGWSIRALYVFAPADDFFGRFEYIVNQPNVSPRPLQGLYISLQNLVFGSQMSLWLIWQGALGALMSLALFVLLRELRLGRLPAATIAALVLIFPAASSIKFWTAPASEATIILALLGFILALRAFESPRNRRFALHTASLVALAASLLLYEVVLAVMLASVLLYRLRVPWRVAAKRWLADCAVLVPIALLVTRTESSSWETQTLAGMWDHAKVFWDQAQTLFTSVVLPLASDRWYVLALVALIPATALVLIRQMDIADPVRNVLLRWLLVVLGGLVVVTLGYGIFVPAMDYYAPLGQGIANRVNAVASVGWVLILYGLVALAFTIAFRGVRRERLAVAGFTTLTCAIVAAVWLPMVNQQSDQYVRAFEEGKRTLAAIRAVIPNPPPGSTIWTFGQPVEIVPGVPVFANTWDMSSSVRLMYDDPSLASFVGHPGTTFTCSHDGVVPGGPAYPNPGGPGAGLSSSYGSTYFVDTITHRVKAIRNAQSCRRADRSFQRSPAYPSS